MKKDRTEELRRIFDSARDGSVINLSGEYYLTERVVLRGKKNIVINGGGALIKSRFDPSLGFEGFSGSLGFIDCEEIEIKDLSFDVSSPTSTIAEIVSIDEKSKTVTVRGGLSGCERICSVCSIDKSGLHDYAFFDYGVRPQKTENGLTVIDFSKSSQSVSALLIGGRVRIRFGVWNYKIIGNSTIIMRGCRDLVFSGINIYSAPGGGMVVFPRCENLTLRGCRFENDKEPGVAFATNVDGLHITGLAGKLTVENCRFNCLGDDAINLHATAVRVEEKLANGIRVLQPRFSVKPEDEWCRAGDRIGVFDQNLKLKHVFTAEGYSEGTVFTNDRRAEPGDILGNLEFRAEAHIKNCDFRDSRARGVLFQTDRVFIENCRFYGFSLPGILIAPDLEFWKELFPSSLVKIKNCRFEKCCNAPAAKMPNNAVITVACSHSGETVYPAPIHKSVTVEGCRFIDPKTPVLKTVCTEKTVFSGNKKITADGEVSLSDKITEGSNCTI